MKKAISKEQFQGAAALLFLAVSVWFGLPARHRVLAAALTLLCVPVLMRRKWAFWIVLAALTGFGAFLWRFRASGYHYTSVIPLTAAALMLVFRFGSRGLKRLACLGAVLGLALLLIPEAPILVSAVCPGESDAPYVIVLGRRYTERAPPSPCGTGRTGRWSTWKAILAPWPWFPEARARARQYRKRKPCADTW